ncbi:hypothetical protein FA15DRAFT_715752, partial [Coprinopsis marcescibilis]
MASVPTETIRERENRTKRWIDAYRKGFNAHEARAEVLKFSSWRYASHRRVSEQV